MSFLYKRDALSRICYRFYWRAYEERINIVSYKLVEAEIIMKSLDIREIYELLS